MGERVYTGEIVRTWEHKGQTYKAIRDDQGFITIAQELYGGWLFAIGDAGYDYCLSLVELPILAARLRIPILEE